MKKIFFLLLMLIGLICCAPAQSSSYKSLSNSEFTQIINQKKTQLVDVRTKDEFKTGHLPNAINIDVNSPDFDKNIQQLNKKNPVAVYCRSGRRSKIAAQKLSEKGFTVYELNTGIMKWDGNVTQD